MVDAGPNVENTVEEPYGPGISVEVSKSGQTCGTANTAGRSNFCAAHEWVTADTVDESSKNDTSTPINGRVLPLSPKSGHRSKVGVVKVGVLSQVPSGGKSLFARYTGERTDNICVLAAPGGTVQVVGQVTKDTFHVPVSLERLNEKGSDVLSVPCSPGTDLHYRAELFA